MGEPCPRMPAPHPGRFLEGRTSPWGAESLKGLPRWRRAGREGTLHCAGGFSP